ncbi:hypothetical protein H4R34_002622 [Dimargaris verticillata]|uniref:Uncharacterized protein n=1 Tax=Dimargaris verticillata TaxID=2761393 RepID=A0A9W8B666_9FUNG|nr:hypothetical protein H4R34_002622 [Dimargaris verticillata]
MSKQIRVSRKDLYQEQAFVSVPVQSVQEYEQHMQQLLGSALHRSAGDAGGSATNDPMEVSDNDEPALAEANVFRLFAASECTKIELQPKSIVPPNRPTKRIATHTHEPTFDDFNSIAIDYAGIIAESKTPWERNQCLHRVIHVKPLRKASKTAKTRRRMRRQLKVQGKPYRNRSTLIPSQLPHRAQRKGRTGGPPRKVVS